MKKLDGQAPMASCPSSRPAWRLRLGLTADDSGGRCGHRHSAMICTAELAITCNHVAKLTCTEVAIRDARTGRSGFPLLRNDLHGKFWLPLRTNVEKPTCTIAANTTQKNWSAHIPALGGLHVRHRTKRVPSAASTYMFHVTDRPCQVADEVRRKQTAPRSQQSVSDYCTRKKQGNRTLLTG